MRLKETLTAAVSRLTRENVPSPRMNAELLLMFTLGCDRAYLYAHPERELSGDETTRYDAALGERSRGVPAQYITGHQEFWGMDLIVTPAVLIPRPETEHVIEAVLRIVGVRPQDSASQFTGSGVPHLNPESQGLNTAIRIVDVGTGSGCIALALAKDLPNAEIHGTDVSAAALEVARANAARHQLERRIHFHQVNLLEGLASGFDIVVSNPPYVGESEMDQVQLEVKKFEPRSAVFAGPTGVEVIEHLIPQAHSHLRPGGWIVLEISNTVVDETKQLLQNWSEVTIIPDLQAIPRVAVARKPQL